MRRCYASQVPRAIGVLGMNEQRRKAMLVDLFNNVLLPQRQLLLQYRDHTWQSAHLDSDGYLAELIAAIVLGDPGRSRHGKGGGLSDLASGTEVKSSYRLDPNIDFVIEGRLATVTGRQRVIEVDKLPRELERPEIVRQLNANGCSVQRLAANTPDTHALDATLARTATKNALTTRGGRSVLRLGKDRNFPDLADGTRVIVCVRQERAHINFGKLTRAELECLFKHQPVFVYSLFDEWGRPRFAVVRAGLTPRQRRQYLDLVYGSSTAGKQVQPYLFADNVRDELYRGKHSIADALKGDLIFVGGATAQGFHIEHWAPADPPPVNEMTELLTRSAAGTNLSPFSHQPTSLDLNTERSRRLATADFYQDCVLGYYRALEPYCAAAGVTRNIGFGNLAQHMVSLRTGLKGTRSGARGEDLLDGGRISDVKLATGEDSVGNPMQSTDKPRLNFGSNTDKLLKWKRFFPVRIVDASDGLHVLLHAPSPAVMTMFRRQVREYFRTHSKSANLQYHALDAFPHDRYGVAGRNLIFARVAWLKPDGVHEFGDLPA